MTRRPCWGSKACRTPKLLELFEAASWYALAGAAPVDASTETDAGKSAYQDGDIHARISSITPGPATVNRSGQSIAAVPIPPNRA